MITLNVNGKSRDLDIPGDMPLLWTLRDVLSMTGTKFGCGMGLCGACTIHIDGQPTRSCITPVSAAAGKRITTIEAIGATSAGKTDPGRLARAGRAAVRLLPVRPDHVGKRAARRRSRSRATRTSTLPWRATSAAAVPIRASAPPSSAPRASPRRGREMKTASIETQDLASPSRRDFPQAHGDCRDRRRFAARLRHACAQRGARQSHERCAVRAERVPAHRSHRQGHVRDAGHRDGARDVYVDPDADRRRARGRCRQGRDRAFAAGRQALCQSAHRRAADGRVDRRSRVRTSRCDALARRRASCS